MEGGKSKVVERQRLEKGEGERAAEMRKWDKERENRAQLAEPLWTDPGFESGISVRELIPLQKKKKKRRRETHGRTFSQNPRKRGISHHHHHHHDNRLSCLLVTLEYACSEEVLSALDGIYCLLSVGQRQSPCNLTVS